MNNIETMKLALEALELAKRSHGKLLLSDPPQEAWKTYRVDDSITKAVAALRQAINAAEQREQAQQAEPWEKFCDSNCVWTDHHPDCKLAQQAEPALWAGVDFDIKTPLSHLQWIGLTNEEVESYWDYEDFQTGCGRGTVIQMVRDIEAKLKEKNT